MKHKKQLTTKVIMDKYFTNPDEFKQDCGDLAKRLKIFHLKYGEIGFEILRVTVLK